MSAQEHSRRSVRPQKTPPSHQSASGTEDRSVDIGHFAADRKTVDLRSPHEIFLYSRVSLRTLADRWPASTGTERRRRTFVLNSGSIRVVERPSTAGFGCPHKSAAGGPYVHRRDLPPIKAHPEPKIRPSTLDTWPRTEKRSFPSLHPKSFYIQGFRCGHWPTDGRRPPAPKGAFGRTF